MFTKNSRAPQSALDETRKGKGARAAPEKRMTWRFDSKRGGGGDQLGGKQDLEDLIDPRQMETSIYDPFEDALETFVRF